LVSDCEEYKTIYNNWIKCDIQIYRKVLEDARIEYLATIENRKSYYCVDAIMEENEFLKIVKKIGFYE
ncbi:MAG: glucosamine-6-phosphate deaminase, partial [Hungatella sp.]